MAASEHLNPDQFRRLYHGTTPEAAEQIRQRGLTSRQYSETHNTLTDSHKQALGFAGPGGEVLAFHVPDSHLWPAYSYWGHGEVANTHALRKPLPPSMVAEG